MTGNDIINSDILKMAFRITRISISDTSNEMVWFGSWICSISDNSISKWQVMILLIQIYWKMAFRITRISISDISNEMVWFGSWIFSISDNSISKWQVMILLIQIY